MTHSLLHNGKGSKLMAACVGTETTLQKTGGRSLINYKGTTPVALRAWFHPRSPQGYEFVYGREEASRIFAASATPVPSTVHDDGGSAPLGLLPIGHAEDVEQKLALVKASLLNMPAGPDRNAGTFDQGSVLAEVLDLVRERIKAFDEVTHG